MRDTSKCLVSIEITISDGKELPECRNDYSLCFPTRNHSWILLLGINLSVLTLIFSSFSNKWILLFPYAADKAGLTSGWNLISVVCVSGFSAAAVDAVVREETRCAVSVNQQC